MQVHLHNDSPESCRLRDGEKIAKLVILRAEHLQPVLMLEEEEDGYGRL